jgi:AcrR family transcriptional regulator
VETAARTIATEGPGALNLRGLAQAADTSTMAVYTHFGGMVGLRHAVRQEGFGRLSAALANVEETSDPVADLALAGLAYYRNGLENPHLYRVMFMEQPLDPDDAVIGSAPFEVLVRAVDRCLDEGRFTSGHPQGIATQLWALDHGLLTLQLAGLLDDRTALESLGNASLRLFTSFGDERDKASRSLAEALERSGLPLPAEERAVA